MPGTHSTPNVQRPTSNAQRPTSKGRIPKKRPSIFHAAGVARLALFFLGRWALDVGRWALKRAEILNVNPPAFRSPPSKHQRSQPRSQRYGMAVKTLNR